MTGFSDRFIHHDLAPLTAYLQRQQVQQLDLSFSEIERIIGRALPEHSKKHRQWWANVTDPEKHKRLQRLAWLATPYDAFADCEAKKVQFRRVR